MGPNLGRWLLGCGGFLTLNGLYLLGASSNRLFYVGNVLAHVGMGFLFLGLGVWGLVQRRPPAGWPRLAAGLLGIGAILGAAVALLGTTEPGKTMKLLLWRGHLCFSLLGVAAWGVGWWRQGRRAPRWSWQRWLAWGGAGAGALVAGYFLSATPDWVEEIRNPELPPFSMEEEGAGKEGPFFPSSAETVVNGKKNAWVPSSFFLDSASCGRSGCHPDIYRQWEESAHHFSSFNNQWYRKTVEYMQEIVGAGPSKWCAGCHDQALLFTEKPGTGKSRMDFPIRDQLDRPEAHVGVGCIGCHAIVHVKDTMGQGGYVFEYTDMHLLAASEHPLLERLHDYLIHLNPKPHKRTFMKAFHRGEQSSAFCSVCHKVHLDVPVNNYRWIRGFSEYDSWQLSGVSGQGARSFYHPMKEGRLDPQQCADCHMPLVRSNDQGNVDGFVHSHRFAAANTAVALSHGKTKQLKAVRSFLQNAIVRVDLFALQRGEDPQNLVAPLDAVKATVRRGETVRVEVVVRTLKVGHGFPGGTNDAYEVWLELQAKDETGRILFWSGETEEDPCHPGRKGPIEADAHFYGTLAVDQQGNPINKRNAWARRAVIYSRMIPPGAADVVHFRLPIPQDCGPTLTLHARLNYRKFSWWYTHFAFAGVPVEEETWGEGPLLTKKGLAQGAFLPLVTPHYDSRTWVFTGDPSSASGTLHEVPDLPIVVLAEDTLTLRVLPADASTPSPQVLVRPTYRERFNDYGIGFLLQKDFRAAEAAFRHVIASDPSWPEGYLNTARVLFQEGHLLGAKAMVQEALKRDPNLPKAYYFLGLVLKQEGELEAARDAFQRVLRSFPYDRVVWNELGRTLYLLRRFDEAIEAFQTTLSIDPEDLDAHYNLMLCYGALGDRKRAEIHRRLWARFKPLEAEAQLVGAFSRIHPIANNERQLIHEHTDDRTRGN